MASVYAMKLLLFVMFQEFMIANPYCSRVRFGIGLFYVIFHDRCNILFFGGDPGKNH